MILGCLASRVKATGPSGQLHCYAAVAKLSSYKHNSWKTLPPGDFGTGPVILQEGGWFFFHQKLVLIHILIIYSKHFSRAGGPGHTLLGSLALRSCPRAGALAGVAIDPIHAASPILAGVANAFINIVCTIRACPARITQAEISRDCCLQVQTNAKKITEHGSSKGINAVSRKTDIYTYFMWRYQSREIKHLECNYIDGDW